jgi:hypothetical protein
MGRPMKLLPVLGILFATGSFAAGCAPGRDVKSAEKEDKLAFDETGKGKKCDKPKSNCDEVKDPSLDFKEKCREGGFRIKQCGCENLCSGNINGDRQGYTSKNDMKTCKGPSDKCETPETSAAYQDACDAVGGEMMECGCEWLCSKKLKEVIPDPVKEEEKKGDAAGGDEKKDEKKAEKPKDEKPKNMDGKAPPEEKKEPPKDKSSKDKSSKDKSSKDKSSSEKDTDSGGDTKKSGRFKLPD